MTPQPTPTQAARSAGALLTPIDRPSLMYILANAAEAGYRAGKAAEQPTAQHKIPPCVGHALHDAEDDCA